MDEYYIHHGYPGSPTIFYRLVSKRRGFSRWQLPPKPVDFCSFQHTNSEAKKNVIEEWLLWFQLGFFQSSKPISVKLPSIFVEQKWWRFSASAPTSRRWEVFSKTPRFQDPEKGTEIFRYLDPDGGGGRFFFGSVWTWVPRNGIFPQESQSRIFFFLGGGGGSWWFFIDPFEKPMKNEHVFFCFLAKNLLYLALEQVLAC